MITHVLQMLHLNTVKIKAKLSQIHKKKLYTKSNKISTACIITHACIYHHDTSMAIHIPHPFLPFETGPIN